MVDGSRWKDGVRPSFGSRLFNGVRCGYGSRLFDGVRSGDGSRWRHGVRLFRGSRWRHGVRRKFGSRHLYGVLFFHGSRLRRGFPRSSGSKDAGACVSPAQQQGERDNLLPDSAGASPLSGAIKSSRRGGGPFGPNKGGPRRSQVSSADRTRLAVGLVDRDGRPVRVLARTELAGVDLRPTVGHVDRLTRRHRRPPGRSRRRP